MYLECKRCGSKHFLVNIIHQENGNDNTYEFVCAGCGDNFNIDPEFDDYQTYMVKGIFIFKNGTESIGLEEWIEEGARIYYVSLYSGEVLVGYKDFSTIEEANKCYKKCTDILGSLGSMDSIIRLFDGY